MQRKQKGFLIALCLCMLSVSGIYGVYRYRSAGQEEQEAPAPKQVAEAETPEPLQEAANSEGTVAKADTKEETIDLGEAPRTEEEIQRIGEAQLARTPEPEKTQEPETAQEAVPAEETPQEEAEPEETEETAADAVSLSFSDDSALLWPVDGNVILNYSMDQSIYFSTLNQYKYHPAIVIGAEVGSEVRAAATGEVRAVTVNEETGTTVRMKLGGGYELLYGQLKEVAVEKGDMVEAGDLIGYISEPTKYYTLEGSNLYLELSRNGEPLNPMEYLQ